MTLKNDDIIRNELAEKTIDKTWKKLQIVSGIAVMRKKAETRRMLLLR
jgi:hypothetical protein